MTLRRWFSNGDAGKGLQLIGCNGTDPARERGSAGLWVLVGVVGEEELDARDGE